MLSSFSLNPIQMGIFGAAHGGGGRGGGGAKKGGHISYNNETWHSYTLPKDPKNI